MQLLDLHRGDTSLDREVLMILEHKIKRQTSLEGSKCEPYLQNRYKEKQQDLWVSIILTHRSLPPLDRQATVTSSPELPGHFSQVHCMV